MSEKFSPVERERDPIYEYVFRNKLEPFIEWSREWWKTWKEETFYETGSYPGKGAPNGLFIRFNRTIAHSPIKGVQAFPYVAVPFLQIAKVPGGIRKMVDEVCHKGLVIDEFTIIEKKYLHGTERGGQFVCIIPTEILTEGMRGKYVYLNSDDLISLASGSVDSKLQRRFTALIGG